MTPRCNLHISKFLSITEDVNLSWERKLFSRRNQTKTLSEHLFFFVKKMTLPLRLQILVAGPHFILQVDHKHEIQAVCDAAV